jgi:hypothetical protein
MDIDEEERERFSAMRASIQGFLIRLRTPSPPRDKGDKSEEEDLLKQFEERLLRRLMEKLGASSSHPVPPAVEKAIPPSREGGVNSSSKKKGKKKGAQQPDPSPSKPQPLSSGNPLSENEGKSAPPRR